MSHYFTSRHLILNFHFCAFHSKLGDEIDAVGKGTAKALCCMGAVIKYMLVHGVLEK